MDSLIATKFKFENLKVWQKSIDLCEFIYRISKEFPTEEKFGLQSQIRRAAVSVSLNIAEGSGRSTNKDFRKFLHDSLGSLREVVSALHIALRLKYISPLPFQETLIICTEISKMLYKLDLSLKD